MFKIIKLQCLKKIKLQCLKKKLNNYHNTILRILICEKFLTGKYDTMMDSGI